MYDETNVHIIDNQEMSPRFLNERAVLSVSIISIISSLLFVLLLANVMYSSPLVDTGSSVQNSILINSSDIQLNYSEFNAYAEMTGATNISEITGLLKDMVEKSPFMGVPVFKGAWINNIETESCRSDSLLVLYKSDQADLSGRDHYYICMWTVAEPDDPHHIRNLWSRVQLTNDESRLIVYTPGSTIIQYEPASFLDNFAEPVLRNSNIQFIVDMNGYGNPFIHRNTTSPKSGECQVGYGGKYTIEWKGCSRNSQEIIGIMHIDVPTEQSVRAEWTNSLHIS